jgi:hypothetical protein
MLKEMAKK